MLVLDIAKGAILCPGTKIMKASCMFLVLSLCQAMLKPQILSCLILTTTLCGRCHYHFINEETEAQMTCPQSETNVVVPGFDPDCGTAEVPTLNHHISSYSTPFPQWPCSSVHRAGNPPQALPPSGPLLGSRLVD